MAATMGDECGVKFDLLDLCSQNLKQLFSNSLNDRVCVVSVIGKSSLTSSEFKASIIDEAVGKNVIQSSFGSSKHVNTESHNNIQGFYDPESHTIFLHLSGISDTDYIIQKCKEMENELKKKSFLELWTDLQYHYAKALLLLFNVSHIVIVVHPNSSFDLSYIYLFRTLDAIRVKALPWFMEQLRGFSISTEWVQAGRPCSPRVLFVFETCPISLTTENNNITSVETSLKFKTKKLPPLKKLEHSVEDQIYRILRKSRVITNISGNSLFAVPPNQEFVYIFSSKPHVTDPVGFYMNLLRKHCQKAKERDSTGIKSKNVLNHKIDSHTVNAVGNGLFLDSSPIDTTADHSFAKFLEQHVKLALTKGFDDNVGRYPTPAYFELPTVETWFEITMKLASGILDDPKDNKMRSVQNALKSALDIDVSFSEGRCAKILNVASAAYQENLPTHYTEEYHQTRLAHALQVFAAHSRGPAYPRFVQKLRDDCERVWKNGHQMCEVLSLTGNHCINPIHRTENEPEDKSLPLLPHCSQVKLVSSCDCGRKQSSREDPFDVQTANHGFYVTQHAHCCGELERIEFPIFQASTAESHPARISASQTSVSSEGDEKPKEASPVNNSVPSGNGVKSVLSEGNTEDGSSTSDPEQLATDDQSQSQVEEPREEIVISIQEGADSDKEKSLIRQPSTTEYLPGMLHSESPLELLPVFSSWSLICLGPSSLYSHNIGLQEQPGFLPGTNFLLPWDVTVKVENKDRWPALWEGKRPLGMKAKKAMRDGPQFNVKIFIGVEYECYRGHRFMCSAPDRVLRVTTAGLVKDNASKVTGSDMPLYFPCPCRSAKPQMAQLMRIHVVTPKAPVHVTLNPRIQPSPEPCPAFFPTTNEPLKLSQSAYWVLRLPFVYEGDQGPFLPPREPVPVEMFRLLKGTYNIAEQQSNR